MKRYICWLTLLGLITIPDWASACYFQRWMAPPCESRPVWYYAPPLCYEPPVCSQPPIVYLPVYTAPHPATNTPTTAPQAVIERDPPSTPSPSVRVTPPLPQTNRPSTAVVPVEPMRELQIQRQPEPKPAIAATPPAQPKLPSPEVEPTPTKAFEEPLTFPGNKQEATPTPAPPPDSSASIPTMLPGLPTEPTPKLPTSNSDTLPPLVLPPEANSRIAKSSPLSAQQRLRVQVFAAEGRHAIGPLRKVCFFNRTNRDLELVIEGRPVKLPKQTYINAELTRTFRWNAAGSKVQTEQIPADAAGLDVVFRE